MNNTNPIFVNERSAIAFLEKSVEYPVVSRWRVYSIVGIKHAPKITDIKMKSIRNPKIIPSTLPKRK